ncbi:hypothetical protein [Nocardia sp. XZ_19_369]|nr:hypothetical protein [Nocardia sp. XZ_19_369]
MSTALVGGLVPVGGSARGRRPCARSPTDSSSSGSAEHRTAEDEPVSAAS